MDIQAVRIALKDAIRAIDGLRVADLRDDPHPPCAIVYPKAPFPLDETFTDPAGGTTVRPQFCVLVLVAYTNTSAAQNTLDTFLSDNGEESVKNAIEKDQTLGGTVSDCVVTGLESYGVIQLADGGTRYLSAELVVDIWT